MGTIQQVKLCNFKACGPRQTYRLLSHCPVDLPRHKQKSAENGAGKVFGAGQNLRVSHLPGKVNVPFRKDIWISPTQLRAVPGRDLLGPWVCTSSHHCSVLGKLGPPSGPVSLATAPPGGSLQALPVDALLGPQGWEQLSVFPGVRDSREAVHTQVPWFQKACCSHDTELTSSL